MSSPSASGRSIGAARGEASVIGVVLLLGLTLLGTTAVVALGSVALEDTQQRSELQRGEHAMAQFDSRAAQVALGDSTTQTVSFAGGRGEYSTDPTAGRITITHANYDGGVDNGSTDEDEELYSGTLGTVTYRNGDTVIAYQGGGVWRKAGAEGTQMVSPPEFHYRGGTLTLPVIQVTEGGGGAGQVRAVVEKSAPVSVQYPNGTATYDDGTQTYGNPLSEGYVVVTIESEFYDGWAEYFRDRTDGNVTEHPADEKVTLELTTKGSTGKFSMPSDQSNGGGGVRVQGIDVGHALTDFSFTIEPKGDQESGFNNLRWSLYTESGQQKFEIGLRSNGNADCDAVDDTTKSVDLNVYYSDDGHSSYQAWSGTAPIDCSVDEDGDDDPEARITLDLVDADTDDQNLTYSKVDPSSLTHYKNDFSKNDLQPIGNLSDHPGAASEGNHAVRSYDPAVPALDTEVIDFVVAHYFAELGPTFELRIADQQSGGAAGVDEDASGGVIEYDGGDRVVTYLHITENGIAVRFE
ncbi:DUF7289 family protein [Halomarina litorea]|uniref:DUF7289 family protein n=1 Tax=Halomarina litorea TaxID=2961595 RepID=UPI0020C3ED14|nr:hypothetical protein [Halomarina sp. BCD28]